MVFYAYTKEVARIRRAEGQLPVVYSYGGRQDADLRPGCDRAADVFPTEHALEAAGSSPRRSPTAVLGPMRVA